MKYTISNLMMIPGIVTLVVSVCFSTYKISSYKKHYTHTSITSQCKSNLNSISTPIPNQDIKLVIEPHIKVKLKSFPSPMSSYIIKEFTPFKEFIEVVEIDND